MANIYIYSGAGGGATGADWANAYLTLKAGAEAAGTAAGDDLWIAHDHAETTASAVTVTFKGTSAAPNRMMCVNRGGSVPPVAADLRTTATVTTTGNSGITLTGVVQGALYFEGITFSAGSGAVNAGIIIGTTITRMDFKNCTFIKAGTTAGASVIIAGRVLCFWYNCSVQPGVLSASEAVSVTGKLHWQGGTVLAAMPVLFAGAGTTPSWIEVSGVDLTGMGASNTLCTYGGQPNTRVFTSCKLAASTVVGALATSAAEDDLVIVNCDSGDTNYRTERYSYPGSQVVETTIVRTGGATDGTTPISWKIVTSANSKLSAPYISLPIKVWCDAVEAKTVSLYGYWNNAAVPTNAQIWMVAEYQGTSGFPLSLFSSSGPATILTAGSPIAGDSSTWGGGVTTSKFKMSTTLTTTKKGPISIRVFVAAGSNTFYIDPKPEITGATGLTIGRSEIFSPGDYVNELSSGTSGFVPALRGPF